jgi:hypothetical protein
MLCGNGLILQISNLIFVGSFQNILSSNKHQVFNISSLEALQ